MMSSPSRCLCCSDPLQSSARDLSKFVAQVLFDLLPQAVLGRGVEDLQHGSGDNGCAIKVFTH
jgi:hypothetical protein